MNDSRGNGLLWALVGCGGLLFVGLCVSAGVGAYIVIQRRQPPPSAGEPVQVSPQDPLPMNPPTAVVPDKPPPTASNGTPQEPISLEANVTNVTGSLAQRVSRSCRFTVEPPDGNDHCRTQITCDSILVYGGAQAGYFPCRFDSANRFVSGSDDNTTSADRDAAMTVDTASRTLQIRDDSTGPNGEFSLTASLGTSL